MNAKRYLIHGVVVLMFILMAGCKKEKTGSGDNLSSITSIPLGTARAGTPYYTLDNTGNYLFLFVRDLSYNNGLVLKINISTPMPVLEKTITIPGSVPISADNVVVTDDNQFIGTFFNFAKTSMLIYKFDANLKISKVDTVAKVAGGNFGRTRLIKNGPGRITGVYSNKYKTKCYLTYKEMDENLKVLSQKTDTSAEYGASNITGGGLIKTSDGGYLFSAINIDVAYFTEESFLEKRDANFNLQWRTKFKSAPPLHASPGIIAEHKGKYYVHCANSTVPLSSFVLVYDLNGVLLQNTPLKVDGVVFRGNTTIEPMRLTENGEFLILASTRLSTAPNLQRGILYHTDANLYVLSSQIYGGEGVVSSLIKIKDNRYLNFYLDNSFAPDNNLPRLVFRYIDAKGVVIK